MGLRPGYKLTEVGVIPEEWLVIELGALKPFVTSGSRGWAAHYSNHGSLFVRITNLSRETIYLDLTDSKYVRLPPNDQEAVRAQLFDRDVLISITADIGILGYVDGRVPTPAYINQHIALVRFDPSEACGQFVSYFLASEKPQKLFKASTDTGAKAGMSLRAVQKIQTALPPIHEQRAIAKALSDVDGLLEGLDRLIAKKRDLKQAAMQRLLTGQSRLPGFSGEWEVKRLGDHLTFLRNGVNSRAELIVEGQVKYLHYGDIHGAQGLLLNPSVTQMPHLPNSKASRLDRLSDGDLVFADASEDLDGVGKSVELQGVGQSEAVSGLHTVAVRFDKQVLADGFKAYLQFIPVFRQHVRRLAAGTKVYATNRAHIASAEMKLPDVEEQSAITAILADMDAELAALEARRDKTRALKQAMMQELLTGRTRLVEPAAEVIPFPATREITTAKRGHNEHFNEAVVIAALAQQFASEDYPLGRFRYTKLSYLLHRHAERTTEQYLRKAVGPYNPKTRYGGAEKIALARSYVREHYAGKYAGFVAADNAAEAERYFRDWYGDEALNWLDQFRKASNDDLELFTTVFGAIDEVARKGGAPSFKSVKQFIADDPEWRAKLLRPLFSDDNIVRAGRKYRDLFGEPPTPHT